MHLNSFFLCFELIQSITNCILIIQEKNYYETYDKFYFQNVFDEQMIRFHLMMPTLQEQRYRMKIHHSFLVSLFLKQSSMKLKSLNT